MLKGGEHRQNGGLQYLQGSSDFVVTDVDAEERELLRGLLGVDIGQSRIGEGQPFPT